MTAIFGNLLKTWTVTAGDALDGVMSADSQAIQNRGIC